MAPKKEAKGLSEAQRKGRQTGPDYCWVENIAVCKAAIAAARVPNQTKASTDAQVGLQQKTAELYAMQLDAAVAKYGWPPGLKFGRRTMAAEWTPDLSKQTRVLAGNLWDRYSSVLKRPCVNQLTAFLAGFYGPDGKLPSGKTAEDAGDYVKSQWWKHLHQKKLEATVDLDGDAAPAAAAAEAAGGESPSGGDGGGGGTPAATEDNEEEDEDGEEDEELQAAEEAKEVKEGYQGWKNRVPGLSALPPANRPKGCV